MDWLIPVQLNNPSKLNEPQPMPKRRYENIKLPVSWLFVGLRVLTSILYHVCFVREEIKTSDPMRSLPFLLLTVLLDIMSLLMISDPNSFKDQKDYDSNNELAIVISLKYMLFAIEVLALLFTAGASPWSSLAAAVVCLSIELFMYRQHTDYYKEQLVVLEEGIIEELKAQFGRDHDVGEATRGSVQYDWLPDDMIEKFWERVAVEARDQSLVPDMVHWRGDGSNFSEYFIDLKDYLKFCRKLKKNYNCMKNLVAECKSLRKDLTRQNELIVQLRKKLYGSNADCSDIEEVPAETAVPAPWIQEKADGLFRRQMKIASISLSVSETIVKWRSTSPLSLTVLLILRRNEFS